MHTYIRIIAILGALGVILGAFAAHGLQSLIDAKQVSTFQIGVRYLFIHTLAMLSIIALLYSGHLQQKWLKRAIHCWLIGILFFSGSLFMLSLRDVHGLSVSFLGPVTPIGGLFFIAGWICLLPASDSSRQNS